MNIHAVKHDIQSPQRRILFERFLHSVSSVHLETRGYLLGGAIYSCGHQAAEVGLVPAYAAYPLFLRAVAGVGREVLLYPRLDLCGVSASIIRHFFGVVCVPSMLSAP